MTSTCRLSVILTQRSTQQHKACIHIPIPIYISFWGQSLLSKVGTYFLLWKVHVKFHRGTFVQGVESPERKMSPRWKLLSTNKRKHQNSLLMGTLEINLILFSIQVLTWSAYVLDVQPDTEGNSVCPCHNILNIMNTDNYQLLWSLSLRVRSKWLWLERWCLVICRKVNLRSTNGLAAFLF